MKRSWNYRKFSISSKLIIYFSFFKLLFLFTVQFRARFEMQFSSLIKNAVILSTNSINMLIFIHFSTERIPLLTNILFSSLIHLSQQNASPPASNNITASI